jgi:putative phosphoesterase
MSAPVERLGVLGDVHAEDVRLAAAIAFLRAARVDAIACVGDVADGEGDVNRCCELLVECGAIAVRGNHDRWALGGVMRDLPHANAPGDLRGVSRFFLGALPRTRTLESVAGRVLVCHGLLDNDMQGVTPDDEGYALEVNDELRALRARRDVSFVVAGHTHRRMVRRIDHLTLLNAGTLRRGDDPCVLVVDFARREALFHDVRDDATIGEPQRVTFP